MMCAPLGLLVLLLAAIAVLSVGGSWCRVRSRGRPCPPRLLRRLRPRTPDDCALCRLANPLPQAGAPSPGVRPGREGRSRRGAPRRIPTEGYACRHPRCPYYGITDAQVHALVAAG